MHLYLAGPDGVRGNATEAYFQAGYTPMDRRVAAVSASQLLHSPKMQAAIAVWTMGLIEASVSSAAATEKRLHYPVPT